MRDYVLKGPVTVTALQRSHIDYLLKRLTEFRKAGAGFGQRFRAPVNFGVTRKIVSNQLGFDLYSAAHFERVCMHLRSKIDDTILGRRNAARGVQNYHAFEEHSEIGGARRAKQNGHPCLF